MFRAALYFLVFFLLFSAIAIFILALNRANKKRLNVINIAYLVITIINYIMLTGDMVDTGWNLMLITPVSIVTLVFMIVSLIIANNKKQAKTGELSMAVSVPVGIIPLLVICITFAYETYLLNSCTYLLEYNYQGGIVTSEDSYLAIMSGKPYKVTLTRNVLGRKASYETNSYSDFIFCRVNYDKSGEIELDGIFNYEEYINEVRTIAEKVQVAYSLAESAEVTYLPEVNGAVVQVMMQDRSVEECYYQDGQFERFDVSGSLSKIKYYQVP